MSRSRSITTPLTEKFSNYVAFDKKKHSYTDVSTLRRALETAGCLAEKDA